MDNEQCYRCKYYNSKEGMDASVGECIANPPTIIMSRDKKNRPMPTSYYPVVAQDYTCRFFAPSART